MDTQTSNGTETRTAPPQPAPQKDNPQWYCDPKLCFCGTGSGCTCPCKRCVAAREIENQTRRLVELHQRLKKANIDPEDLATLVLRSLDATIEQRIDRLARDAVNAALKGTVLVSRVSRTSLEER